MAASIKVPTIFTAVDKFSGVVSKMTKRNNNLSASLERTSRKMKKLSGNMALAGGVIVGSFGIAVNSASSFEKSMANVSTLIDTNTEDFDGMKKKVLELSKTLPVPIEELTASLYDIRSAGIAASDSMDTLETAAKLSKAGLSTTSEATNILTSAINAFASEGLKSSEIANILFKTVKAGKTNMAELSQAFGANAGIMQSAGVKLADFQAATAALTTTGTPAAQVQNQLRSAIVKLKKPSSDMERIFKGLGVTTDKELIKKYGTLGESFKAIQKQAEKSGVSMAKAWGSSEALAASTSLLGAQNEAYLNTLGDMNSGTDALSEAFQKQQETTASKIQLAKNNMQALSITIGTKVAPMLTKIIDKILPVIDSVTKWIDENPNLVKTLAIVGGTLLVFSGFLSGLSGVFTLASFAAGAFGITLSAALWPILLIIGAIAGVIAIIMNWSSITKWFGKQWELFTSFIGAAWRGIVNFFSEFDFKKMFMNIGRSIIRFMLMPLKWVLSLLAKLPGTVGSMAQAGLDKVNEISGSLEVKKEVLPSTSQAASEQITEKITEKNSNLNVNIRDKGGNVESVESDNDIPVILTNTQGAS